MPKKMLILMVLAILLAACLPSHQPAVNVQDQVNTAVAGTMQANQQIDRAVEQTVAAQNAAENAEAPADVEVVLQATTTNTPFADPSFTSTPTHIPLKYTCAIVNLKPRNGTTYRGGEEFQVKFKVINTGTRPWPIGIDVKYVSGSNLTGTKRVEIPKALEPGQVYLVDLDGKAPTKSGYYMMTWLVDGPMCYGSIGINVK